MAKLLPLQQTQRDLRETLGEQKLADYFEYVCQELRNTGTHNDNRDHVAQGGQLITIERIRNEFDETQQKNVVLAGDVGAYAHARTIIDPEAVLELARQYKRLAAVARSLLDIMQQKNLHL